MTRDNQRRRIFVAGLNDNNVKRPPFNTNLFMFNLTGENGSIKDVHLYEPDNIVIADVNWLKDNWYRVEQWIREENGSHFQDLTLMEDNLSTVKISPINPPFTEYQKSVNSMPRCEISIESNYELLHPGKVFYGPYQCGKASLTPCIKCGINVCYYHSTHENICSNCNKNNES